MNQGMYTQVECRDRFVIPYTLDGASRHDRVLQEILDRQKDVLAEDTWDRSDETFDSAEERQDVFDTIVDGKTAKYPHVLVSEFYLYDDVGWRDETALEMDIARFDRKNRTVYCIETTGKNLASVRESDKEQKKDVIRQEALDKGMDRIDRLQRYMDRVGWAVAGEIAAYYQHGKQGRTDVEVYEYDPMTDMEDVNG